MSLRFLEPENDAQFQGPFQSSLVQKKRKVQGCFKTKRNLKDQKVMQICRMTFYVNIYR